MKFKIDVDQVGLFRYLNKKNLNSTFTIKIYEYEIFMSGGARIYCTEWICFYFLCFSFDSFNFTGRRQWRRWCLVEWNKNGVSTESPLRNKKKRVA